MKKPKPPPLPRPGKPPRNPHAKVLGKGPYKPKVEKGRDAYIRRPKHPRPAVEEGE
ncbi:MAG: hypothetical protein KDJ86_12855 [Bauldia sp.]|uniref:hypothetical protein n=1 Tax=Bauldia sp. TaxID=2575872 RepID=UPI001E0E7049|nr:hypothetical protein [Bauldia sp.]MCB1496671.1 hypothetical protein [Bauldia sp.]